MANVAILLVTSLLCAPQLACAAHSRSEGAVVAATCTRTDYLLRVHPRTIVSNERHRLEIQASTNACGRGAPARGARVRLGRYHATTNAHGRATLTVQLPTGRYLVRLYVHQRLVARTSVNAIPYVTR
jgi:hypothetical protein